MHSPQEKGRLKIGTSEGGVGGIADATHVDFHLLVETIVHDQSVSHSYTCGLHPARITHVRSWP